MNIINLIQHIKTNVFYRFVFGEISASALVIKPLKIENSKSMRIGAHTYIGHYAWLMGNGGKASISLDIGNNVSIGHFCHIVAKKHVYIENYVLIADKVFISDCTHSYEDIMTPIINQEVKPLEKVTIGEGTWLGENVCVCGASVGKHCVIGANSVVTKDIPDYSVAVGSPARVVKYYDFKKNEWVRG